MKNLKHISKSVMVILMIITLFACQGNKQKIQQLNLADDAPVTEGKNINLKYTDSGRVVYNLITPDLKDYTNFDFAYQEFPNGIEVRFWDDENKKSILTSNYAVSYTNTNLIDLQDNVVLKMSDSTILRANQLYWDKVSQWVFTNEPYQIEFNGGSTNNGSRFDSNQEFTNFLSRDNKGIQIIDKQQQTNGN